MFYIRLIPQQTRLTITNVLFIKEQHVRFIATFNVTKNFHVAVWTVKMEAFENNSHVANPANLVEEPESK